MDSEFGSVYQNVVQSVHKDQGVSQKEKWVSIKKILADYDAVDLDALLESGHVLERKHPECPGVMQCHYQFARYTLVLVLVVIGMWAQVGSVFFKVF